MQNKTSDLTNLLNDNKKFVLECFSEGCLACELMESDLNKISKLYPNISFIKLDIQFNKEITSYLNIECTPTLLFYDGAEFVCRLEGRKPIAIIKSKIEKFLMGD